MTRGGAMKIEDLMTRGVVSTTPETSLKEVARMLVEHRISGLPVCDGHGVVVGVVSEADILVKERGQPEDPGLLGWILAVPSPEDLTKMRARTVAEAMSTPPIVVAGYVQAAAAARILVTEGIKRLPVVDQQGALVGIVTRGDLVRAFARPDEEVTNEILEDVVRRTLWAEPGAVEVAVRDGEVELTGELDLKSEADLLSAFVERVPGVVSVRSEVTYRVDDTKCRLARRDGSPTRA
jgi:CBS domain-containing protein